MSNKSGWGSVILAIVAFLGFIGLMFGLVSCLKQSNDKVWNDGHCVKCGGDYEFVNGSHQYGGGDIYFYACEDCGHIIKLFEAME